MSFNMIRLVDLMPLREAEGDEEEAGGGNPFAAAGGDEAGGEEEAPADDAAAEEPAAEEGGEPTVQTVTRMTTEEQDVEETITKTVPDMSGAEEIDIFAFGYGKLKAKLDDLFGAENVIDC